MFYKFPSLLLMLIMVFISSLFGH